MMHCWTKVDAVVQEHSSTNMAKPSPAVVVPHTAASASAISDRYPHIVPASYAQAETQTHGLLLIPSAVLLEADAPHVRHVRTVIDTAAQCSDARPAARTLPSGVDSRENGSSAPFGGRLDYRGRSAANVAATRAFLSVGPIRSQVFSLDTLVDNAMDQSHRTD